MATPRDKFMELRKSGVDAQTARKQAYGDINATMNAPASQAVNDLGGDVANRANTRNVVTGQGGTRTPNGAILNADGTVTQTPESIASNAGSTIVGNQYDQRTAEQKAEGAPATPIQAQNSTGGVLAGVPEVTPTPTTTPPAFNAPPVTTTPTGGTTGTPTTPTGGETSTTSTTPGATGATGASTTTGKTTEVIVPTSQSDILNTFVAGGTVPPQNTPEYRKAKASYDSYKKVSGLSKQEYIDAIKLGKITTEMNSMLAQNPAYQEAKAELDRINNASNINRVVKGISQSMRGEDLTAPDYFESISDSIIRKYGLNDTSSQDAFKSIVKDDEDVIKATTQLQDINRQVADTTKLINDGYKEFREKYQGKLSASEMINYMGNRFRDATDLLSSLNNSRTYIEADLKNATDMAIAEYGATQKDIAQNQAIRNALLETELGFATKSAELAMQEQYAKPQFQQYGDKVYQIVDGQLVDTGINTTSNQWQSANITRYNPSTGANESTPIFYRKKDTGAGFEAVDLSGNPIDANILGGGTLGGTVGGGTTGGGYATGTTEMRTDRNNNPTAFTVDIAKQAGLAEGVDYVVGDKFPGSSNLYTAKIIGDPIETSIRVIDKIGFKTKSGQNRWTYTDKLGLTNESWAKMSPTDKATAIKKMYQQEGGNGKAIGEVTQTASQFTPSQVLDFQNYKSTGKVPDTYKTPADQARFRQSYDSWSSSQEQLQSSQYTDQNIADLSYLVELQDKNPTQAANDMKQLGYTARDLANYKAGNVPLTEKQKTTSTELMGDIADLVHNYDFTDATGWHFFDEAPRGSDWENANTKIENIVSKLTLPSLGMLKGPMSDKDLAFIKAASNNLATTQSDVSFERQLIKAYNLAARRAGKPEVTKLSEIPKDELAMNAPQQTVGGEIQVSKGTGQTLKGKKGDYYYN